MIVIRHSFISVRPPKGVRTGAAIKAARSLAIGAAIGHIKYIQHRSGKDKDEKSETYLQTEKIQQIRKCSEKLSKNTTVAV